MASAEQHGFGHLLRSYRLAAGLTQEQLAERAGLAVNAISALERGERRNPYPQTVALLADALALAPDDREALVRARARVAAGERPVPPPAQPLLLTKILAPPPRTNVVPRPRLSERLDQLPPGSLGLLVAAAGSGKTTLLSAWVASLPPARSARVAWLALEAGDDDPQHLLRYLIAALARVDETLGAAALAVLEAPQPATQAALTLLLNDLSRLREPLTLILDDYHLIQNPAIHQALVFFVEHLPPTLQLIIATREDPPLPLTRLRARGQLVELRGGDLRFSSDEAAALLSRSFGLALADDDIAALVERTEGWGAGLQIAGLALRGHNDPSAFIASFSGSQRLVLDYLADEVLARLPGHVLRFLLHTSILECLCGPLCDAALGLGDTGEAAYSQLMLDELQRLNLFIVPLDDTGSCYRYQHLFGTLLRERLRRGANPELLATLHGRVARWYADHGMPLEAARHAVDGGHWEQAAALLVAHGEALLHAAPDTLAALVDALPEALRDEHPQLWYLLGARARQRWDYRAVQQLLQRALGGFARQGDAAGRGRCLVYLADAYRIAGDPARALTAAEEALAAPLSPRHRTAALMAHAMQLLGLGCWPQANEAVDAALELVEATDDPQPLYELALAFRSPLALLPGGTARAAQLSRVLRSRAPAPTSPLHAQAHLLDGIIQLILGEPSAAGAALQQALALDEQLGGLARLRVDAQVWWVGCAILQGDLDAAAERYEVLWSGLEPPTFDGFRRVWGPTVMGLLARIRWLQGDAAALHALVAQLPPTPLPGEWPTSGLARRLIPALLALAEGRERDAEAALLELLPLQEACPDAAPLGDARLILAHLYLGQGRTREALALLDRALAAHREAATPGLAALTGAPIVAPLLRLAQAHRLHQPLVARLLQILGAPEGVELPEAGGVAAAALVAPDALTPRELEVLRLIAAGADNRAIADRLVLSVATVKKHINNLFAKLDAQSRTQALVRARERHLL